MYRIHGIVLSVLLAITLTACSAQTGSPVSTPTPEPTPTPEQSEILAPTPEPTPVATASPTPEPNPWPQVTIVDYSDMTPKLYEDENAHDFEIHFLDLSEEEYNARILEIVEMGDGEWDYNDVLSGYGDLEKANDSIRLPGARADVFLTRDKQGQYHAYYEYLGPSAYGSPLKEDGEYTDCFGGGSFSLADQDWGEVHSVWGLYYTGALEGYAEYDEDKWLLTLYPSDLYDWADHYLASQGIEATVLRPPQDSEWRHEWLSLFFAWFGDDFFPYGQ